MKREEFEEGTQTVPSEVWGRMSAAQREHVYRLITRIACEYVEACLEGREEDRAPENTKEQ